MLNKSASTSPSNRARTFSATATTRASGRSSVRPEPHLYQPGQRSSSSSPTATGTAAIRTSRRSGPASVFFDSSATDLLGTPTTSTGRQIYRAVINDQPVLDPPIEQWTFGPGNSWMPAVEPNGGKVIFLSDGDLLLNGTTGTRLFSIDFRDPVHQVLYQITGRGTIGPTDRRQPRRLVRHLRLRRRRRRVRRLRAPDLDHHVRSASLHRGRPPAPGRQHARGEARRAAAGQPERQLQRRRRLHVRHLHRRSALHAHARSPKASSAPRAISAPPVPRPAQQGQCSVEPPLNCDDNDKCTDDTCDPNTGCAHTPLSVRPEATPATWGAATRPPAARPRRITGMSGVTCQGDQVKAEDAGTGQQAGSEESEARADAPEQAEKKKPKGAKRKLKQAAKLFKDVLPDITNDPSIPRDAAAELVIQIRGLLDADLKRAERSPDPGRGASEGHVEDCHAHNHPGRRAQRHRHGHHPDRRQRVRAPSPDAVRGADPLPGPRGRRASGRSRRARPRAGSPSTPPPT